MRAPRSPIAGCIVAVVCILVVACSDTPGTGPVTSRETAGDTTIVRLTGETREVLAEQEVLIGALDGADEYTFGEIGGIAVSGDGTIYVLDSQALVIRVYSAEGDHIRTFGRSGGGPGELSRPSGMLFLNDGRLLVRDAGNARMNIYGPEGETLTTWTIPGGFITDAPIFTDSAGNVYTDIVAGQLPDGNWNVGLMRMNSAGETVDTIYRPFADHQRPSLRAERTSGSSRSVSITDVPFWPQAFTTLNRRGEFVGGIADRYAVLTWKKDSTILRIERVVEPTPVEPAEAAAARERITRSMRDLDSGWSWDGPAIPSTKPAFRGITAGEDDRIWVRLSRPGVRQAPDENAQPDREGRPPVDSWVEPAVYDVYESTGDYVATVRFPERFRPMVLRGEHAWGVLRDEYDVQYVVRLRIAPSEQ